MIVVHLKGGLGSQMFQYAAAKSLALHKGDQLKLYYKNDVEEKVIRTYSLNAFKIPDDFASSKELNACKPDQGFKRNVKKWLGLDVDKKLYKEPSNRAFDTTFFDQKGDVFLSGYWQDPKYFKKYQFQIRQAFRFKNPPRGKNKEMLERIRLAQLPVSVHFRIGEDVRNIDFNVKKQEGFLSYYSKAAREMTRKIGNPTFFVFSDQPDWVRKNLDLDFRTEVVDINVSGMSYEDLRLMSNCRHHIIAKSTFSWWGAWLNPRKDKIVIAPNQMIV